jgi:Leucine-rich repeat (LRR) protein
MIKRSRTTLTTLLMSVAALLLAACNIDPGITPEPTEPAMPVTTSVKVSPTELILVAGEASQLTALVISSDDHAAGITWSSDAEHVATVDQTGLVTARTAGTATVTVSTVTGDQSAHASITVIDEPSNEAPEPIIQRFTVDDSDNVTRAGAALAISWTVQNAAELRLTAIHNDQPIGEDQDLPDLNEGTVTVHLPTDIPTVNYRLTATNSSGIVVEQLLQEDEVPLPGWICSEPQQEITFHADIEDQIRQLYDLEDDRIQCEDVQKDIESRENKFGQETANVLFLSSESGNAGTLSLEGLQHLSHLRRLELEHNNLTDISALHGLSSLVELNLDNNLVSDLTPLASLHKLEILGLYNNEVESLHGLEALTSLRILYLSNNRIRDLSPLTGLKQLEHLWLYLNCSDTEFDSAGFRLLALGNCLSDISPVAELSALVSLLLGLNEVTDLSPLANLDQLQMLQLAGNGITNIEPLRGLPRLRTALLDSNYLTDLSSLAGNSSFAAGAQPFVFERGSVELLLDSAGKVPLPNLTLAENCLNVSDPATLDHFDRLDAHLEVIGFNEEEHYQNQDYWCGSRFAAQSLQPGQARPVSDSMNMIFQQLRQSRSYQ